jgi:archaemetzincin
METSRRDFMRLGLMGAGCSLAGLDFSRAAETVADISAYQNAAEKIRPLFSKKKPPGPSDWLATQTEFGQTFAQYLKSDPNRRTAERTKLYLQPIGDFTVEESAVLKTLREFMSLYFGLEVVALEKIPVDKIPPDARRTSPLTDETQFLSTHILDKILLPKRPKDAVAVLAITATDLWPGENWNFVFGQASLDDRVGVWSTRRFGDPVKEPTKYLRRVLQVAVHETGHMFGIEHCIAYECCMNGSNSLAESDRASMVYCCECDPKLWWACKLEPATRAKALAEFSNKHSLQREAAEWQRIAKALGEK